MFAEESQCKQENRLSASNLMSYWQLVHALNTFEKYDVNLTMIESRPTKTAAWQYLFYIDVQGHTRDSAVTKAVSLLKEHSLFVRILGSYPEAV